jgi:hypothetical protein
MAHSRVLKQGEKMKPWQGRIPFALLISALLFISVLGCGMFHPLLAGGPYRGRVIDAETKQPLEGAVVLAIWETKTPGVAGYGYSYLDSEEVLTDENGRFVVGRHPPRSLALPWVAGPRLEIFYPGYGFYPRFHFSPRGSTREHLEMMETQELTIELPYLKTRAERLSVIREAFPGSEVPRKKMPNLMRLINTERKSIGIPPYKE